MYWARAFRVPLRERDSRGNRLTRRDYFSYSVCLGSNNFEK